MKDGTLYGGRLKKAYARLRAAVAEPDIPDSEDMIRRLAIAVLGEECGDHDASKAVDRIVERYVDWNEVRVSTPQELHEVVGDLVPDGPQRCKQLIQVLQAVYEKEHRVSLDRLTSIGRREAKQFLESLPGCDEYVTASLLLWCLEGHAIPIHRQLHNVLREAELVHPAATRAEVQAFLERHVAAAQAKHFCVIMNTHGVRRRSLLQSGKASAGGAKKGSGKLRGGEA